MTRRPRARSAAAAPKVSAIVVCKDRLDQLKRSLPLLMAQPFHEVVVVDYDCPAGTADWVAGAYPAAKVARVHGPPAFSAAIARNRGAAATTAPWLFFVDVDVLTQPTFLAAAFERLRPGVFLVGDPLPPELWGTVFMQRRDFDAVGGYDEVFQGWGVEDADMNQRLELAGVKRGSYDGRLVECIQHDDELRTRHHEEKDRYVNGGINEFYRELKRHLESLDVQLTAEGRSKLYADVRKAFAAGKTPSTFEVVFRQQAFWGLGWTTSLKFQFFAAGLAAPEPQAPNASPSAQRSSTA